MCTILWPELVDKILKSQKEGALIVKHRHEHHLTSLDIANRIMRKENYFLAMINLGAIDFSMQQSWVGSLLCGGRNRMLTKTMDWNLKLNQPPL